MSQDFHHPIAFSQHPLYLVPTESFRQLAAMLIPQQTNFPLLRCGSLHDGGYLIPHDLEDIAVCFSPRVSDNPSFEMGLWQFARIQSHQADYSIDQPPPMFTPLSFSKRYLGRTTMTFTSP